MAYLVTEMIALAALAVSAISLGVSYISHMRAKKSEEIRISREIWDRMDAHEDLQTIYLNDHTRK